MIIPNFFVDGATGVGKTTFINLLKENLANILTITEEVENFTNVQNTGNILERYFSNPQRWALSTNIYITLTHVKSLEITNKSNNKDLTAIIMDRSIYSDYYIHAKMEYRQNQMDLLEYTIYKEFFDYIEKNTIRPTGFIYLKASPELVLQRVHERNRTEERNLQLQYQKIQAFLYDQLFIEKKDIPENIAHIPVLILDATKNFKDDIEIQKNYINQVKNFIELCIKNQKLYSST